MENEPVLTTTVADGIGTLVLNRPEKGNALSPDMLVSLRNTLQQWATADTVRCVIITGKGDKAFSTGYDIAQLPGAAAAPPSGRPSENPLAMAFDSVRNFPYPVIAMVNGHMFGAGLNLALCCDLRIGSERVKAAMPPARLGLVYPIQGLKHFVDTIGIARTREVFFTGRTYVGEELKTMGLIDRQVSHDHLSETTYHLASEIAANAPLALQGIKRLLNMLTNAPGLLSEDLATSQSLMDASMASEDAREGQLAFFEKRKPKFLGR